MEPKGSLQLSQFPATCPYTEPAQSVPYSYIPLPEDVILSSHLCLGLPRGLFPSGFPTQILYTPLPSTVRATCPAHLIIFYTYVRYFIYKRVAREQYEYCSMHIT
jgi:hypothetical protein